MSFDQMKKYLGLRVSKKTAEASRFLEFRGFQFCVDFGTDNAIEKMAEVKRLQRRFRCRKREEK